eukprot:m.133932 g.133932  ORF g.133932 m.133932 type:complete len:258 (-) comp23846_c0_seq1:71-844(-)
MDLAIVPFNAHGNPFLLLERTFEFPNFEIKIKQDWMSSSLGTGRVVWDCSLVLCHYLTEIWDSLSTKTRRLNIIEVGAGTALVGVCCAKLGARVVATDLPELVPLMLDNVHLNQLDKTQMKAEALTWGSEEEALKALQFLCPSQGHDHPPRVDFVVASDVFWVPSAYKALLSTLKFLCQRCRGNNAGQDGEGVAGPKVLVAFTHRYEDRTNLFLKLAAKDFLIKQLPLPTCTEALFDNPDAFRLLELTLKVATGEHE